MPLVAILSGDDMSWSWSNPSQEEATEAYEYYKSKYYSAANQKRVSERQEQTYISEKNAATTEMNSLSVQKMNFEERVRGIEDIIKMLEGNGGWFSTNVPSAIEKTQKSLSKTDSSFRSSIRLTGGGGTASMEASFAIKSVEADAHSSAALSSFKSEKKRLEQEITNLSTQIANLSSMISSLTSKINACNATQASLQSAMNSYAYDMNHYKKFTY